MKIKELAKEILTRRENRRYAAALRERQGTYAQWLAGQEEMTKTEKMTKVSEKTQMQEDNSGFVIVYWKKGDLASDIRESIGVYFREHPQVQLLYGDEDVNRLEEGAEADAAFPWFKPDWSPDLLDSFLYFGGMTALRKELFQQAKAWLPRFEEMPESGNGAELYRVWELPDYERWVHICAVLAGGYQKGSQKVGHIPKILFHQESREEQEKFLVFSLFLQDAEKMLLRDFRDGWIVPKNADTICKPVISVVIPSKDQPDILEKCLRGCLLSGRKEPGQESVPFEMIVVDNGSSEENKKVIEKKIKEMKEQGACCDITYLYHPMEFHFSKMCNLGAAKAQGKFLLFLNDDVELCQPGGLTQLAALADRQYTGAVGLKLYYPDSIRIQHAGITNLPIGPVHKLQFMKDDRDYYYGANKGKHNVLAVTAACLMIEKDKYLEAGGFSEALRVAFNDVDFCFRLYELGYRNVCVNSWYAYHHESLSRGDDESTEKLERLLRERDKLYERHPQLAGADPYYSPHLNRAGLDTGIRPAYLTAGNEIQKSVGKFFVFQQKEYHRDDCLMVRMEDCRGQKIIGYGVVLGDNNACYEKMLLLKMTDVSENETVYALSLEGQYRPDLEENMPDQVNVALCGFDVEIGAGEVPAGRYRLGLAARSRVSGIKLINWSNRFVQLNEGDGT